MQLHYLPSSRFPGEYFIDMVNMGQVPILSIVFCACVIGIAISAGIIAGQTETAVEHRQQIINELECVGKEAQNLYLTRGSGGHGTFLWITATPSLFRRFIRNHTTTGVDYFLRSPGANSSMEILAVGRNIGLDGRHPVRVKLRVWPVGSEISVLN